jgi:molybdopterin-guanine dinucleotide biosynthesis protein A
MGSPTDPPTLGAILAGGLARRMGGGDKPLLALGGRPLLRHVVERLAPQCAGLIISANGDPGRFAAFDCPVVPDDVPGHPGPLGGILAALEWAQARGPAIAWVVTVPGDTPFIPDDLVERLHAGRRQSGGGVACAVSCGRIHPAVGLWSVGLKDGLRETLLAGSTRSVQAWARDHGLAEVEWPCDPVDPFFNVNTVPELMKAEGMLHWTSAGEAGFPAMIDLDLSGLKCPLPALRTRKALRRLRPGERLRVTCTDPLAGIDIPHLVHEEGDRLVDQGSLDGRQVFTIERHSQE